MVSSDNHIETMATFLGKTYDEIFLDVVGKATSEMMEDLRQAIESDKNIYWDQTNTGSKSRINVPTKTGSRGFLVPSFRYEHICSYDCLGNAFYSIQKVLLENWGDHDWKIDEGGKINFKD